jgi:hypothetical protein
MSYDRVHWRVVMNATVDLMFPYKAGNFLNSCVIIDLRREIFFSAKNMNVFVVSLG